ncbi:MAG: diguanylate cyclase [Desulfotomaculaceae bacterium]|nr:diguanylate cyclase [Desulfotomaculaceae bacterium]
MKIQESELKRHQEMHEYLTTTHMLCLFTMIWALVLSNRMFSMIYYNATSIRFSFFFAAALLGFILITKYNTKNTSLRIDARFTWVDFLYISFPLAIAVFTLLIVGGDAHNLEVILLLPVIITASLLGKKAGMAMAAVCTSIIIFSDMGLGSFGQFIIILESNLILFSVMFIIAWFVGAQTDLNAQSRQQLTKLASVDILTGLYNYGYFYEKINDYIQNASEKHPLALIIIDIDYFKHYNDIHGHPQGDQLLVMFADILSAKAGQRGLTARYGGDEFVVVLPATDSGTALQLAEEIGTAVRSSSFPGQEYQPEGKITVSCGVAAYPTHARNAKELVNYADQALYRAKSLDKNTVKIYFSVFDKLDLEGDDKELLSSTRTLLAVINAKDRYTYGHSERVTDHAIKLAHRIGLDQEQIQLLGYASFLHDIGKIEINREILNKTNKLDAGELAIVRQHCQWGSDIVKAVKILEPIVPVILHHHENYDGTGYPAGLRGNDIPLLARIIRIADSFDAMISHRPYKENVSIVGAIQELRLKAGTLYDGKMVECFLEIIAEEQDTIKINICN